MAAPLALSLTPRLRLSMATLTHLGKVTGLWQFGKSLALRGNVCDLKGCEG